MVSTFRSFIRSGAPATAFADRTQPLRSSTFRLTAVYLATFGISAILLLSLLYMAAARFMERQTEETVAAEMEGLIEQFELGGMPGLRRLIAQRSVGDPERLGIYLLTDHARHMIAGNITTWPSLASSSAPGVFRFTMIDRQHDGAVMRRPVVAVAVAFPDGSRLLVGRDVDDKDTLLRSLRRAILWGGLVMVVLGVVGGFLTSRWILSRLERVNRTTAAIMAGNLGQRIARDGSGDEFDRLAAQLNAMLQRIEGLLAGMREVTDNIAHDLRTPLSRMRARIEVALMSEPEHGEARELLEATMRDADGLISTFNALLNITRAESGAQRSEWELLSLRDLARDVFELYEPLAEEKSVTLTLKDGGACPVRGNRQLLAQAIANLVDNAIKYTPTGGAVAIATSDRPRSTVTIADSGPGIPVELREKALERFVRLDPDRSGPGSGLGLSLVSAVARLHDARLVLDDNGPGLRVSLEFDALPMPAADRQPADHPPSPGPFDRSPGGSVDG